MTNLGKAVAFAVLAIGSILATGPLMGLVAGVAGLQQIPMWAYAGVCVTLLLALTAGALRVEGSSLRDLGLAPTHARIGELLFGCGVSALLFASIALVRGGLLGVEWKFAGLAAVPGACLGLVTALLLLLPEELIFRGFAFQRVIAAIGAWPTIVMSALLFGAYHAIGSQMWGMGLFFQIAMPTLGGMVFGWAAVRTRGLALPIGLHLGGNWVQVALVSFKPLQGTMPPTLWTARLSDAQLQALYAPDLLPHLPYIAALLTCALIVQQHHRPLNEAVNPNC
jgi:uncharacterized protein